MLTNKLILQYLSLSERSQIAHSLCLSEVQVNTDRQKYLPAEVQVNTDRQKYLPAEAQVNTDRQKYLPVRSSGKHR